MKSLNSSSKAKHHVRKGDTVSVLSGNHRGATGRVIHIIKANDQVIVEGVRMMKKHMKKSQERPNGGIVDKEGPIHISNVRKIEVTAK